LLNFSDMNRTEQRVPEGAHAPAVGEGCLQGAPRSAPTARHLFPRPFRRFVNALGKSTRLERADLNSPGHRPWTDGRFAEELWMELSRSRRYGRPFCLIRIPCPPTMKGRSQELALALCSILRAVDRVWSDGADIYVLLPECGRANGQRMLTRNRNLLLELLSEKELSQAACAAFPEDALTSGALLRALHAHPIREIWGPPSIVSTTVPEAVPVGEEEPTVA
jgi:hypothetical protein